MIRILLTLLLLFGLVMLSAGEQNSSKTMLQSENLGIFGLSRKLDVLGQDGVTPIPLNDVLTMWTFGDTIIGKWKKNVTVSDTFNDAAIMESMLSNSAAFTENPDDNNVQKLKFIFHKEGGKVAPIIKNYPDEDHKIWRFWAIDGIKIGRNVYVYFMKIKLDPKVKGFAMTMAGMGLARWEMPKNWKPGDPLSFKRLGTVYDKNETTFGDGVMQKDGYLYLIGHAKPKNLKIPAQIARVKVSEIEDKNAYRFLKTNGNWTENIKDAGKFLNDVCGECSLSYNPVLKKYVIIYCQFGTAKIILVTFDDFSQLPKANKRIIHVPPELKKKANSMASYYSGKEIFATEKYIYSIYIHPLIYQPILLKTPYQAMGFK
ncbi:DUF4185 domain-containing protein [Candidatus Riflebacteria bacterium]